MNKKVISYSLIIIFLILAVCGFIGIKTYVYPLEYKDEVLEYSKKYNLDPYLVFAVINAESGFDKHATSSKNAKGLMQITESTAKEVNEITNSVDSLNEENIYNEDINIELGCQYLASLISRYNGNYYLAICSYNAGIGNVDKWISQGQISQDLNTTDVELPFKETTKYLKKVIHNYKMYKVIYPKLNE